jgi:hypothetical protein
MTEGSLLELKNKQFQDKTFCHDKYVGDLKIENK